MSPANQSDGFTSLLVQEEGGTAETIVSEENGILISMMLRQYFMALRTVNQWRDLSDHWRTVADKCSGQTEAHKGSTPDHQAGTFTPHAESSHAWSSWLRTRLGLHTKPINDNVDSDDDRAHVSKQEVDEHQQIEGELWLMRKYFGRWAHRVGARRHACDAIGGEHFVDWAQAIAPKLEGRIQIVQ